MAVVHVVFFSAMGWRRFSAVGRVVFASAGDQQAGVKARQLGAVVVLDAVAAPVERLRLSALV